MPPTPNCCARPGELTDAAHAYERAITFGGNAVERAELQRRLRDLSAG